MTSKNNSKKRVRIQSGHQARYIENRSPYRHIKRPKKAKLPRKAVQKSRNKFGRARIHRSTVAELVYQFLERASNRGVARNQKTNATNQFRKFQRRKTSKRLKPDKPGRVLSQTDYQLAREDRTRPYTFPYENIPSEEGNVSIEKCIFEVLSFGTVLGLLIPADRKGIVFRISSDLELFKNEREKQRSTRKRRAHFDDNPVDTKRRCSS